jgi:Domain of unknown function (DUF4178)
MSSVAKVDRFRELRRGDRINYRQIEWRITEYNTYDDAYGYKTEEWMLKGKIGKPFYLLREIDPENPKSLVNWYLAEEFRNPKIYQPDSHDNLVGWLPQAMQNQEVPYPELKMFGISYYFESRTEGTYDEDNNQIPRITWDYWDELHNKNLALEAWPNGELHVYLSQIVKPDEFTIFKDSTKKLAINWLRGMLAVGGIMLLVVGCSMLFYG